MSFRECAAWVMAAVMGLAGLCYLLTVRELGGAAPPTAVLISYTVLVVVGSVVAHTVLAIWSPRDADAPADERERPLLDRAGNWSGWVLGAGVVGALWHFLFHGDAVLMFHLLIGSLIVSQLAEYGFQIFLFRRHG
ncbi:hypothetical protein [Phenylobacterium sp.]|uniref:hypothetical protein n=1 Tax=Phenylobacterium sp. TaxID=1871053 RepID=UPI0035B1BCA6